MKFYLYIIIALSCLNSFAHKSVALVDIVKNQYIPQKSSKLFIIHSRYEILEIYLEIGLT